MSEGVLFRLQAGRARLVSEAVDAWKAGHEEALRALDAEALVAEVLQLGGGLRRLWDGMMARAGAGQIKDYQRAGELLREAFERDLGVMQVVAEAAGGVSRSTGHDLRSLTELLRAIAEAKTWTSRVLASWPWDDRLWPALDRAAVEASQAATARGEGEELADIVARLKAGGPLVKE